MGSCHCRCGLVLPLAARRVPSPLSRGPWTTSRVECCAGGARTTQGGTGTTLSPRLNGLGSRQTQPFLTRFTRAVSCTAQPLCSSGLCHIVFAHLDASQRPDLDPTLLGLGAALCGGGPAKTEKQREAGGRDHKAPAATCERRLFFPNSEQTTGRGGVEPGLSEPQRSPGRKKTVPGARGGAVPVRPGRGARDVVAGVPPGCCARDGVGSHASTRAVLRERLPVLPGLRSADAPQRAFFISRGLVGQAPHQKQFLENISLIFSYIICQRFYFRSRQTLK